MFAKTSFGVIPLATIVLVLAGISLLAAWLPAVPAGNLDPVTALRTRLKFPGSEPVTGNRKSPSQLLTPGRGTHRAANPDFFVGRT